MVRSAPPWAAALVHSPGCSLSPRPSITHPQASVDGWRQRGGGGGAMSAPSTAKELLARLLPTWRNRLINLNAKRRQVLWGDTQVVLRVRDYPKSKTE